jgi:hypothetical protein
MREVCVLVGAGDAILWADAGSAAALPDSRARWEAIWARRGELVAIAHSHPLGPAAFSAEDESTMQAIDAALGRPLHYYVVAPRVTIVSTRAGAVDPEPWWAHLVRLASGMRKEPS